MKKLSILFLLLFAVSKNYAQVKHTDKPPAEMMGSFEDDYHIHYKISDTLWLQLPNTRFHIIKWNVSKKYFIARNDNGNPGEGGLYTRIDYMEFSKMGPWKWGYCLTAYSAATDAIAEATAAADRDNPMKGCGGYPFSRMKAEK
ncbi:MAG TPA: hypothetical protein VK668_08285 [Mucilaginibacter sp.]|nr:hypothetical protein [Mucilaginibacter sp.]